MFKKAVKEQIKIRLALSGPSGSGKTFSALSIAQYLGKNIALIDTEHESSLRYADRFDFDMCNLDDAHPAKYIEAINAAERAGYEVIIIDSMTHAWFKELEMAGGNFNNWAKVRPLERKLIDTIISSKSHIIATMRSKTEYAQEQQGNGKTKVTKLGTKSIQSDGIEYEFDIAGELSLEHILTVSKSRCPALTDKTFLNPGADLAEALLSWANAGEIAQPKPEPKFTNTKPQAPQQLKQQQQPVQVETEDFPKPPAIWDSWKSLDDAINWAWSIIPDADKDFLVNVFKGFPKTEDKTERGKLWVATINEFHQSGNYKKVQPEPEPQETELEPVF